MSGKVAVKVVCTRRKGGKVPNRLHATNRLAKNLNVGESSSKVSKKVTNLTEGTKILGKNVYIGTIGTIGTIGIMGTKSIIDIVGSVVKTLQIHMKKYP